MASNGSLRSGCQLLGEGIRNFIRSGITITSITQCVEELVLNSIDAEARSIHVYVDLSEFTVKVEDDGVGIKKNELEVIGTRHTTSKCHTISDLNNLKYYGYRGEALASIIDISSTVEICSRTQLDRNPYTRKFKEGISNGVVTCVIDRKRPSHGLTITVHGLLSRLPVRQKQVTPLEIERIKKILERIYLMNPRVQIDFKHQFSLILRPPTSNSVSEAFQFLYKKSLIEVFSSYNVFYFHAWFSKESHHTKNLQLLYVNNRYISRNRIHRAVSGLLMEVLGFGKKNGSEDEERMLPQQVKQYPTFVLNILMPLTEYDITLEPQKRTVEFKNWEMILEGIETLGFRFRTALVAENKNKLVVEGMKKSIQNFGTTDFGKNISSHSLTSALHSRLAKRVTRTPPQQQVQHCQHQKMSIDSDDKESEDDFEEVNGTSPVLVSQSKMSKFKSPDKPKLSRPNKCGNEVKGNEGGGYYDSRNSNRTEGDVPLFPNAYNKRPRLISLVQTPSLDSFPLIMDKIQEKFPLFRDVFPKKDISHLSTPVNRSIPNETISRSEDIDLTNDDLQNNAMIDSSFKRLCLSPTTSIETIDDEEIYSPDDVVPERRSSFATGEFCRPVPKHKLGSTTTDYILNVLGTKLAKSTKDNDLPFGEEIAANLQGQAESQSEYRRFRKAKRQQLKEFRRRSERPSTIQLDSPVLSIPMPTLPSLPPPSEPSPPKSVIEIMQLVLENQLQANQETFLSNLNFDQIGHSQTHNKDRNSRISTSDYWQRPGPIETQITKLETQETISAECRFEKSDLKRMRVIGQVDNKFIVAKCTMRGKEALVLFDQHAVHERIRLEKLLTEIQEKGGTADAVASKIKCVVISPPLSLDLSDTEVRILKLYMPQFEIIGIQCEVPKVGNSVLIHSAPLCFVERISTESKWNRDEMIVSLIQNSIQEQVRHIVETNGNVQPIPQQTFEILCTQACHGAIKFGDHLDRETCAELIKQLSTCNFPFQCAHGRPVLTPLLDLTSVEQTRAYHVTIPCLQVQNR